MHNAPNVRCPGFRDRDLLLQDLTQGLKLLVEAVGLKADFNLFAHSVAVLLFAPHSLSCLVFLGIANAASALTALDFLASCHEEYLAEARLCSSCHVL